jgi:hypothetical protein
MLKISRHFIPGTKAQDFEAQRSSNVRGRFPDNDPPRLIEATSYRVAFAWNSGSGAVREQRCAVFRAW